MKLETDEDLFFFFLREREKENIYKPVCIKKMKKELQKTKKQAEF